MVRLGKCGYKRKNRYKSGHDPIALTVIQEMHGSGHLSTLRPLPYWLIFLNPGGSVRVLHYEIGDRRKAGYAPVFSPHLLGANLMEPTYPAPAVRSRFHRLPPASPQPTYGRQRPLLDQAVHLL